MWEREEEWGRGSKRAVKGQKWMKKEGWPGSETSEEETQRQRGAARCVCVLQRATRSAG